MDIFPDGEKVSIPDVVNRRTMATPRLRIPCPDPSHALGKARPISLKSFLKLGNVNASNIKTLVMIVGPISRTFNRVSDTPAKYFGGQIQEAALPAALPSRSGSIRKEIEFEICDQSGGARLIVHEPLIQSTNDWGIQHPILLISSPGLQNGSEIIILARTTIEFEPDINEVRALRTWAQDTKCFLKANHSQSEQFDGKNVARKSLHPHFALTGLDKLVRANSSWIPSGEVAVILTNLNLVSPWEYGRFFSGKCCAISVYANQDIGACSQCGRHAIRLCINPDIVGEVADETGTLSSG